MGNKIGMRSNKAELLKSVQVAEFFFKCVVRRELEVTLAILYAIIASHKFQNTKAELLVIPNV